MKKAILLLAVIATSFSAFAGDKNKLEAPDPAMAATEKAAVAPAQVHMIETPFTGAQQMTLTQRGGMVIGNYTVTPQDGKINVTQLPANTDGAPVMYQVILTSSHGESITKKLLSL